MSFVYALSKILKVKEKSFIRSLKSFKGLPHRHEIFYKKNNKIFINDSKATSFDATKSALKSNKNIFWIVGGLPKTGDKFKINGLKKNIIKAYVIGKYLKYFQKIFTNRIDFELSKNMKNAIGSLFKDIRKLN